jgi:hypothetical protein
MFFGAANRMNDDGSLAENICFVGLGLCIGIPKTCSVPHLFRPIPNATDLKSGGTKDILPWSTLSPGFLEVQSSPTDCRGRVCFFIASLAIEGV